MRVPHSVASPAIALLLSLTSPLALHAQIKEPPRQVAPGPATTSGSPQFQPRISGDVAVGERAPDFELDGSYDRPVRLSSYRGQWVLLVFGDRKETVAPIREIAAELDSAGIALLGICNEKAYFLVAFARRTNFPFPVLADITREISAMYGVDDSRDRFVQPGYVLIGPKGNVRFALLGQTLPPDDIARLSMFVAARP